MAVPTIYTRLITAWEAAPPERRAVMSRGCQRLRFMVSGSAALPVSVLERWKEISGPGYVGTPLPGAEVRLVEEGQPVEPGTPGEIEVSGPSVFLEYWRKPETTRAVFRDGWFRTGDIAVVEDGAYRILGRSSVDIIKTGGYKVSALEIEEVFREHPGIRECAVVGLGDPEWGERVAIAVVPRSEGPLSLEDLRRWAADRLAPYKLPTRLLILDELPRNAMGKVTKPEVVRLFREGHG